MPLLHYELVNSSLHSLMGWTHDAKVNEQHEVKKTSTREKVCSAP